jgi:hypothetical protein
MPLHLIDLYNFKPPAELSVRREETHVMRVQAAKTSLVRIAGAGWPPAAASVPACRSRASARTGSTRTLHRVLQCRLPPLLLLPTLHALHARCACAGVSAQRVQHGQRG